MDRLNFYPGFPDELEDAEGLRKTAALRVRAANMFAAGDGINQALLGSLLADAEMMLEGVERASKHMPLAFEPKSLPPLSAVAAQAHVILNAMSGAQYSDKQDIAAIEELLMGVAEALDRHVEREERERMASDFKTIEEVARAEIARKAKRAGRPRKRAKRAA